MRILVGVKRVVDYATKIRVNPDKTSGVDLSNVKMSLNPFCEIAVEESIRLKESGHANEVIALSVGPKGCADTLKTALAMGADRGIHVNIDKRVDYMELQPKAIAEIFSKVIEKEEGGVDLVLMGKQGIDSDAGQTGPMLAGMMGWAQVTCAANIDVEKDGDVVVVERETDDGTETIRVKELPAVVTCDLRLNEPRYTTVKGIMQAKKKKIEVVQAGDLGVDLEPKNEVLEVFEPPPRKEGVLVENVDELIDKLRNEAGVI